MIEIYTDGAYNSGLVRGGWGAVIVEDGKKRVLSGTAEETTSNRMEITAALEGINHTPENSEVVVHTDSQYLFGCMTQGWQRRANRDLWEKLDGAAGKRKVRWEWSYRNTSPLHKEAHELAFGSSGGGGNAAPAQTEATGVTVPKQLTHLDEAGRASMVDIAGKPDTLREAVAKCLVRMQASTFELLGKGGMPKGDVLAVAQVAGIMAAKQTPFLIPLCHPIQISEVRVEFILNEKDSTIEITGTVKSTGKTGVEMEALTAVAVAGLTVYDMCKAVDRGIKLENIRLVRKSGGKSGTIALE